MKQIIDGNEAAALAAKLARVKVISAYPITPQTTVVEKLAEYISNGELDAEFIKVESEHSAMSACIGAAATGVRAFTATSSQGLLLMNEMLYVASGLRLPIVMTNANRSVSAPLSIWCDQQDSMTVRDSGWIQLYCENNQEILDTTIQAFRIAEEVLLPVMVCYDGYILSHTLEPVDCPSQEEVDAFLPPYRYPYALDPEKPVTMGPVGVPEYYMEFRYLLQKAVQEAKPKIEEIDAEFRNRFGRGYGIMEKYQSDDAEVIILTMGSLSSSSKDVVDRLRKHGEKVGLVKLKSFRPFPVEEMVEALGRAKAIAVIEKDISLGHAGGLFIDTAAAFVNRGRAPLLLNFICGLAGRDVTSAHIEQAVREAQMAAETGEVKEKIRWLGLQENLVSDD
ncbi:MAG: pyruvate synthase subunit PorA [Candidatus Hadarchaeum sp.]|uniref:pyruvate synthase subunit PorA n=1 Tax=Candidatus Hadarchaeum sp. TaxID=2883567 RepID=UPI003D15243A